MINKFLFKDTLIQFYSMKIEYVPDSIGEVRIYPEAAQERFMLSNHERIKIPLQIGEFVGLVQIGKLKNGTWEIFSHLRSEFYTENDYAFTIQKI